MRDFASRASIVLVVALICAAGCGGGKLASTAGASGTSTGGGTTEGTTASTTTNPTTTSPTSDASTTTGGGESGFCRESCVQDADCLIEGEDIGYTCVDGRCSSTSDFVCTSDDECDVLFSGWTKPCTSQMDCWGLVCIAVAGEGRCALAPSDLVACDDSYREEIAVSTIEGKPVIVCGETGAKCDRGVCKNPCESEGECAAYLGRPHCNWQTRACECESDSECQDAWVPGYATCNDGVCGCGTDEDCDGDNTDICVDGVCGCSSDATCTTRVFDGTMIACE